MNPLKMDILALRKNLRNQTAIDKVVKDLAEQKRPRDQEDIVLWNFAHNLLAMSSLSQDLTKLERADRLEIESAIGQIRRDLQDLFLRTQDEREAFKDVEMVFQYIVSQARKKFQDPRIGDMFNGVLNYLKEKAEISTIEEDVEEDIKELRSALDAASPSRIQRAVDILKSDLTRWEHPHAADQGLIQRAKLLLNSVHKHHLD